MPAPTPLVLAGAPDYFGSAADIADATNVQADASRPTEHRCSAGLALAWWLRQRDTHRALELVAQVATALDTQPAPGRRAALGRLALIRGEAALLDHRPTEVAKLLVVARLELADDPLGLGDTELLHASLLDQQGGDRLPVLRAALAHYQAADDALRTQLAMTWIACVESTADPDRAQAHWGPAMDEAAASGVPGLVTFVEAARATQAWRRGDPGTAIACYQRSFDAALACGQLQSAITVAQNIGVAFSVLNDHEGALEWADRARAIAEPTGWVYVIGWCTMQTGSILLGLGRAEAARTLLLQGMPLFDDAQGSRNHVLACQILGEACIELQDHQGALHWSTLAVQGARRAPYRDLIAGTLRFIALAESRLGHADAALATANQALVLAEGEHDWPRVASLHHVMAEIARRHRLQKPAGSPSASATIHHLQAALDSGARMTGFNAPPEWLQELSVAQQAAGDLEAALASERLASVARQRLQSKRSDELATAMLVRHRTAQAEAEAQRQRTLAEASELRAALVSTRSALEQERLQRMLVHAGKLAAVGRLAAGVVHEMSHPVGTVTLLAEALQAQLADEPEALRGITTTLLGESRRLQHFITRLREFARADPLHIERHDLRSVVADARALFVPRLAVERIALHGDAPSIAVAVDPQRLALAVANLVFNAADALAGRPQPRIDLHGQIEPARVLLHVDDNGPGLSETARARLFEPFFTTRPEGLGLGLALSAESLAAMDGRLTAGHSPAGGARFTIELPRSP